MTLGSEEFLELETARRGKKRLYYTAKAGDTLAKLGRRYGLTPGDLARINRFSYNTELHEGDRIVVYSPTGDAPREVTMGMTPEQEAARARRAGAAAGEGAADAGRARRSRRRRSPRRGAKPAEEGRPEPAGQAGSGQAADGQGRATRSPTRPPRAKKK